MTWAACALWGLFGGFAVEGLELSAEIRRTGTFPWRQEGRPGPAPFAVSVVIRLVVGAGLAAAVGAAGPINPLGALAVGVAAPLIIEKIADQIPVQATPAVAEADAATGARTDGTTSNGGRSTGPSRQPADELPGAGNAS